LIRASHAASGVATESIAGRVPGRAGPFAVQGRCGSSTTDETAADEASSRARTTIHSESARQQAMMAAATAANLLYRH
jgi:hypothetical protein